MNGLLIILFFCLSIFQTSCGQKTNNKKNEATIVAKPFESIWVNDDEKILSEEQIIFLDSAISRFEKETTNEILIATLSGYWTTAEKFDSVVLAIHNKWGIGKPGVNNGIVVGISTELRRIRISNGYGIEGKLSDEETKRIIDDIIIPEFKKGNYFEGIKNGLLMLMQKTR